MDCITTLLKNERINDDIKNNAGMRYIDLVIENEVFNTNADLEGNLHFAELERNDSGRTLFHYSAKECSSWNISLSCREQ